MEIARIEELLERYYSGETTLEEEKSLVAFFSQKNIPGELKSEQLSFRFYQSAQKESINNDRLKLNSLEEKPAKILSIKPLIKITSVAAAGLILFVGTYYFTQQPETGNHITYHEEQDSQIAYLETKKALLLISQKLNKGTQDLNKISKLNEIQTLLTPKN